MQTKLDILDNVNQYSVEKLLRFIKEGAVTYEELCNETNGELQPYIRIELENRLENVEDDDWANARINHTIEVYQQYLDTYQNGKYREAARNYKNELNSLNANNLIESTWSLLDKSNESVLRDFCYNYPDSIFCAEAKKILNQLNKEEVLGFNIDSLIKQIKSIRTDKTILDPDGEIYNKITNCFDRNKLSKFELLEAIRKDNNLLRGSIVNKLADSGYVEYKDIEQIGISIDFLQHMLSDELPKDFGKPKQMIEKIDRMSTEVYFWGIPSSGKTCAIGGVLSVANNGSVAKTMKKDNNCQGYGYMTRLSQIFKHDKCVSTLPGRTSIFSTYEMGFSLEDQKNLLHPITLVDLAGELVRCMYKNDANEGLTVDESQALHTLTDILIDNRTNNRKIHFFVIEYGAEDRLYEGLDQDTYLSSAVAYIERTGIFKKDTDGVYILISKVDKAQAKGDELRNKLREYIRKNYQGFYNGLEHICRTNEINGGKVEIVPYSLGEVCFQDYCQFKESHAVSVVELLLARSKGFKTDKLSGFLKKFTK